MMRQLRRFARNVGWVIGIQCSVLLVILILFLRQESNKLPLCLTIPLTVLPFIFAYGLRGILVRDPEATRRVMNTLVYIAAVAAVLFRSESLSRSPSASIVGIAFVSAYMGCYFWLLSDEEILLV